MLPFLRVSPLGILSLKPKRFFIFFKPTSLFKKCRDPRKHNKFELLNFFLVCKRKTYIQQTYKRWRKHDKSLHILVVQKRNLPLGHTVLYILQINNTFFRLTIYFPNDKIFFRLRKQVVHLLVLVIVLLFYSKKLRNC